MRSQVTLAAVVLIGLAAVAPESGLARDDRSPAVRLPQRAFILHEVSIGLRVAGPNSETLQNTLLYNWDLGLLRNGAGPWAWGASLGFVVNDATNRFSLRARGRRWLDKRGGCYFEFSPGICFTADALTGRRTDDFALRSPSLICGVDLGVHRNLALALTLERLSFGPSGAWTADTASRSPTYSRTSLYAGAKVGGMPALVTQLLLVGACAAMAGSVSVAY